MTPTEIALVQTSYARVAPIAETAADLFFRRLFEIAPHVRPMFPDDLADQKKKLMAMLGTAVAGLGHPDSMLQAVRALSRRHGASGVMAEHHEPVGSALMWALEQGLGPAFTLDVGDAWAIAYAMLSTTMIEAESDEASLAA